MAAGGGFSLLLSSFVRAGTCRSSASYASSLLRTVTGLLSQAAASALKRSVPDDMFLPTLGLNSFSFFGGCGGTDHGCSSGLDRVRLN